MQIALPSLIYLFDNVINKYFNFNNFFTHYYIFRSFSNCSNISFEEEKGNKESSFLKNQNFERNLNTDDKSELEGEENNITKASNSELNYLEDNYETKRSQEIPKASINSILNNSSISNQTTNITQEEIFEKTPHSVEDNISTNKTAEKSTEETKEEIKEESDKEAVSENLESNKPTKTTGHDHLLDNNEENL